jgi:dTDP-4-amino-4,6-dideoxygalactose transaminase
MITHSKLVLEEESLARAMDVLRSGQVAQEGIVKSFEEDAAAFVGVSYGVAVSSGTAALHLSLLSLGVGEGSEVILPSYVCTALLNAVQYVRATPMLADIDPATYNITVEHVRNAITDRTKALIVPHMFGLPADIDAIVSLGIPVIEDCAHSVGARVKGKCTGSFGRLSIVSFYATKMLGAGEGGMVFTDDCGLAETVSDLRAYDEKETYVVRYNYKMTDLQAAVLGVQLKNLPRFIERRREIAAIYHRRLEGLGVSAPAAPEERGHIYYRYIVGVQDPGEFISHMRERGIECKRPVFKPLHRYLDLPGYPCSEEAWKRTVSIPIYPSLRSEEIDHIQYGLDRYFRVRNV